MSGCISVSRIISTLFPSDRIEAIQLLKLPHPPQHHSIAQGRKRGVEHQAPARGAAGPDFGARAADGVDHALHDALNGMTLWRRARWIEPSAADLLGSLEELGGRANWQDT